MVKLSYLLKMTEFNTTKNPPPPKKKEKEMSFWDHLTELRIHVIRAILSIIPLTIVVFVFKDFVFNTIILAPIRQDFISTQILCRLADLINSTALCLDTSELKIISTSMSGQFLAHMQVSLMAGVILAFPYIVYEIWSFIKPALKPNEAKHSSGAVLVSSFLFLLGVLFSYFVIVPLSINFFGTYHVSESVGNTVNISSYLAMVSSLCLWIGVFFELPVFVFFLTKTGLITPNYLRKNRKYTIVIMLIMAAIITPPDVISQVLVVIPLLLLYELSIVISSRVYKKKQEDLAE